MEGGERGAFRGGRKEKRGPRFSCRRRRVALDPNAQNYTSRRSTLQALTTEHASRPAALGTGGGVYEAHGDIHRGVVIQGIQGTPKAFFSYPSTIFHRALVTLITIITAIVIAILVVVPWSMIVLCRVGRYLTPAAESCQFRLEQPPLATRARATLIEQATQRGAAPS